MSQLSVALACKPSGDMQGLANAVFTVPSSGTSGACDRNMGPHCWWWGPGYFFGAPWSMVFGLLFWALVIFAIVRLVMYLGRRDEPDRKRPVDILKERYARGEIEREEFEHKKRELEA